MIRGLAWVLSLSLLLGSCAAVLVSRRSHIRLPFTGTQAAAQSAWQDFGGLWSLQNGVILNRSDELGAKLVAGSAAWTNVQLSADMRLLGHRGEVGLVVRANEMAVGINAYRGYYAGFRSMDGSLILGFSDRDWLETRPVPLRTHVLLNDWLHLKVVAVGCDIAAELTVLRTAETVRSLLHQDDCVPRGRLGLRSLSTGAAWRNLLAQAATPNDLAEIQRFVPVPGRAQYPMREDDLARMLLQEPGTPDRFFADALQSPGQTRGEVTLTSAQPIASLQTSRRQGISATIQAAVTQVDPLYVEDSSGGIAVRTTDSPSLNLGDELELVGQAVHANGTAVFQAAQTRLLWDGTPVRPVALSSDQAASGSFDGSLVELSGKLLGSTLAEDGRLHLRMSSGTEDFSVVVPQSMTHRFLRAWDVGSTLRVRGVCTSSDDPSAPADLFRILARSIADIQVIATPPWTSGYRLGLLIAGLVFALAVFVFAYMRAERWKMRAVYEERERLAADMHDTLAQSFAGVGYQLQSLRRGLRDHASVPEHLMHRLDQACELATDTHREASTRITALHFAADETLDVLEVIQRALTLMVGTHSPLKVLMERAGSPRFLPLATRDALYRIGHEALANVLRHSQATTVILRLRYERHGVLLEIVDNGIGLRDPDRDGFGLSNMRARAAECNGTLSIRTALGEGTTVSIFLRSSTRRGIIWRHSWVAGLISAYRCRIFNRCEAPTPLPSEEHPASGLWREPRHGRETSAFPEDC